MTDPTAKGYTAPAECGCTWSCMVCEKCPRCEGCEHVPGSPYSRKLPAKAAPKPKDDVAHTPTPWVRDTTCGAGCDIRASNGRKVAATYGVANTAKTHEGRMKQQAEDRANADLIVRAVNASCAAPESEDEAFERVWHNYMGETIEGKGDARYWWNARARMDAERRRCAHSHQR
jgi:hypothetical protein